MIPKYSVIKGEKEEKPSKTYRIDFESGHIKGFTDGMEAVRQAVYKILSTERFQYIIYSRNYGREFKNLYGKPRYFVYAELESRIRDALLQDDRITSVYNFSFHSKGESIFVRFTVESIFGKTDMESVVS